MYTGRLLCCITRFMAQHRQMIWAGINRQDVVRTQFMDLSWVASLLTPDHQTGHMSFVGLMVCGVFSMFHPFISLRETPLCLIRVKSWIISDVLGFGGNIFWYSEWRVDHTTFLFSDLFCLTTFFVEDDILMMMLSLEWPKYTYPYLYSFIICYIMNLDWRTYITSVYDDNMTACLYATLSTAAAG